MKERMPFIIDIAIGVVLIAVGLVMRVDYYDTMVLSAGFGLVSAGLVHLLRVIYWQAPQRQEEYLARRQEAHINAVDERKQFLRMKAGHIAYQIMLVVLFVVALVLALARAEAWVILLVFLVGDWCGGVPHFGKTNVKRRLSA